MKNGIIYRTPYLLPIFNSETYLNTQKEEKLFEIEQLLAKNEKILACSGSGMIIEPLQELLNVLSHIKIE